MAKTKSQNNDIDLLRFVTAGSIDDGKSTLVGRLLYDTGNVYEDQIAEAKKICYKMRRKELDLSLFTDGLSAEREQGITIDVAYRYFSTPKRRFIVADVPGHEQYTRNMATGASVSDLAIILVDASKGITTQTKRHLFITSLMNTTYTLIVSNKMDIVGYSEKVFKKIKNDVLSFAERLGIKNINFMPASALKGDMVIKRGKNMNWYEGLTLVDYLEQLPITGTRNLIDFRFPVQTVIRGVRGNRGYAGVIESGIIRRGEEVRALPTGKTVKIDRILVSGRARKEAICPQSVILQFDDEIDVSRGDMIVRPGNMPETRHDIEAIVFWAGSRPLSAGDDYLLKHTTKTSRAFITEIRYKFNVGNLHRRKAESLKFNEIGRVSVRAKTLLMFDSYKQNKTTGNFILIDEMTKDTVGSGIILRRAGAYNKKSPRNRQEVAPKKGFVLWMTGLSGAGKTTIAKKVIDKLGQAGVKKIELLDGDVLRNGLTRDLGFSKKDRDENIKRVGFVAEILRRNGVGVLASLITPYRKQRADLRRKVGNFIEVSVCAPLDVCESRDPKGLYGKARKGEIGNFTGISDPYEASRKADLKLETHKHSVDECADKVIQHLIKSGYIEL